MRAKLADVPLVAVLLVVAVGLFGVGVLHAWRTGSAVIGLGLLLGALLRLTLPTRQAGLLAVRSRGIDAAVLLTLGFGLVALAASIPAPPV